MNPKCAQPVACDAWEAGGWDRGHALAGSVGLGEAGLGWGGSLYWVAGGWDPMWGGGGSAKGKEGLAGVWMRVEWWLVCGVAA